MKLNFIWISILLFSQASLALDPLATTQLSNSLKSLEAYQKSPTTCDSNKDNVCPQIVSKLLSDDKKNSFMGLLESRYPICQKFVAEDSVQKIFPTSRDLAAYLAAGPQGARLGATTNSEILRCAGSNPETSKDAVSRYYYAYSRMAQGQAAQLENIASLDLVLGERPLTGISCSNISLKQGQDTCQKLQQGCSPQQGVSELAAQSLEAKQQIAELEKQKAQVVRDRGSKGLKFMHSEVGKKLEAQAQALDFMIESIRSRHAWMSGEAYQKALKSGKTESEAITAQLRTNRQELRKNYGEGQEIQACLAGKQSSQCSSEKVREYLEKMPLPEGMGQISGKTSQERKQSAMAGSYLMMQQCLHEGTVDRQSTAKVLSGAAIDALLTGATLGLGSLYSAPKALISARSLAMARYARAADQAVNAGYFGKGLLTAADACLKEKNIIDMKAPAQGQCSVKNVFVGAQATSAYDSCVSARLWAVLDGLPFASGFLQKSAQLRRLAGTAQGNNLNASEAALLINRGADQKDILRKTGSLNDAVDGGKARLALSEEVLGRKLSAEESDWVLQAHNKHSDKTYRVQKDGSADELSVSDLRDKLRNRPSSLSSTESRRLVESGILGNSTANTANEAQRLKVERALSTGLDKGNRTVVDEGFKEGREYYLKLSSKPENLPADWHGAQNIMDANAKGLTSKESANLFDQFLQKNSASAPENYRSMVGQLSEEIQRLENLKTQDTQWKNYQIWRAKELRYELLERYYTRKYTDKFNDIDMDKMRDRELRIYQELGNDLEKARQDAKKAKWPGSL